MNFLTNKCLLQNFYKYICPTGNNVQTEFEEKVNSVTTVNTQQQQPVHVQQPVKQFHPPTNMQQVVVLPSLPDMNKLVPVQITLPSTPPKVFNIQVPASVLNG